MCSSIGLDIGPSECKFVEIKKVDSGFELLNCLVEPVKSGDVSASIKKIISGLETPCRSINTSISGKGTLIRFIEMPSMSITDLKNSFDLESDKYFPFSQDQIYTDCCIIDEHIKGKKMLVMAAGG